MKENGKIYKYMEINQHTFEQSLGQRRNHKGIRKYLEYKKRKKYKTQKEEKAVLSQQTHGKMLKIAHY